MNRWTCAALAILGLLGWLSGCGKGEPAAGGGGGSGGAAGADEVVAPLPFDDVALVFPFRQTSDGRQMRFEVKARSPRGWRRGESGTGADQMAAWQAPNTTGIGMLDGASFVVSATCHGACVRDRLAESTRGVAAKRLEMAGGGSWKAKLRIDEEVRPGVHLFVVDAQRETRDGKTDRKVNVGVTHLLGDDWEYLVFCEALLHEPHAAQWEAIRDACVGLEITMVDPLLPPERAAQEEANLARCPEKSAFTYTPLMEREGNPAVAGGEGMIARARHAGSVSLHLANFAMTSTNLRKNPLTEGQAVLALSLTAGEGAEVLSGAYAPGGDGAARVSARIHVPGGRSFSFSSHGSTGQVEVIARTRRRVCGRFELADRWQKASGTFVTDL